MPRLIGLVLVACLGCSRAPGVPDMVNDKNPPTRSLFLSLETGAKAVKVGEVPSFKLTIRNAGDGPQRVIDLSGGRRADLQDTYYDLEVTRDGRVLVDIPRMISDPGPIQEKDFLLLKPGEKATFELTRFAVGIQFLPPGEYQARIRFRQDPLQPANRDFFSPHAGFTVRK
jgi:hypothetical protein